MSKVWWQVLSIITGRCCQQSWHRCCYCLAGRTYRCLTSYALFWIFSPSLQNTTSTLQPPFSIISSPLHRVLLFRSTDRQHMDAYGNHAESAGYLIFYIDTSFTEDLSEYSRFFHTLDPSNNVREQFATISNHYCRGMLKSAAILNVEGAGGYCLRDDAVSFVVCSLGK